MITSRVNGTSVFVSPIEMEDASTYKPNVTLRMVGGQHFLSGIQTADYVYNFRVSRSALSWAPRNQVAPCLCSSKWRE